MNETRIWVLCYFEIEEGEELSEGFDDELYISSSDEGDIEETISTVYKSAFFFSGTLTAPLQ